MGEHTLFFATYELGLTVVFGLISAFVTLFVLRRTSGLGDAPLLDGNVALGALYATSVVAVALLVHAGVVPSVDAMRAMVLSRQSLTLTMGLVSFGYFLAFYVIALVMSLAIIWLGQRVYMASTPDVDETEELRRGNLAVSIVLCAVILGLALATRPPLERFVHALVDFESLDDLAPEEPPSSGEEGLTAPEPPPMPR